jgi:hypothetical protein
MFTHFLPCYSIQKIFEVPTSINTGIYVTRNNEININFIQSLTFCTANDNTYKSACCGSRDYLIQSSVFHFFVKNIAKLLEQRINITFLVMSLTFIKSYRKFMEMREQTIMWIFSRGEVTYDKRSSCLTTSRELTQT